MKKILILSILLINAFAWGQNTTAAKPQMHVALETFIKILPYSSDEMKFTDPKNQDIIQGYIEKLNTTFKGIKHLNAMKQPLFAPNAVMIQSQLNEVQTQFKNDFKNMARIRLNNSLSLCVSCHTQLPQDKASSFSLGIKKINRKDFQNSFEFAEFQFLTRNFNEAKKNYLETISIELDKIKELNKISKNDVADYNIKSLHDSYRKILQILLKVQGHPKDAITFIDQYSEKEFLPTIIKTELLQWKTQLKKISDKNIILPKDDKTFSRFIEQVLTPFEKDGLPEDGYEMDLLFASGVLSKYLYFHQTSSKSAEILYWMGVIAHRLNLNLFFDMGELYLISCIENYSKDPVAKKCLTEFENQIIFGYTGSSGTDIPKDKKDQINKFKNLIK